MKITVKGNLTCNDRLPGYLSSATKDEYASDKSETYFGLKFICKCTKDHGVEYMYRDMAQNAAFKEHAQVVKKVGAWSDGTPTTEFYITQ